MKICRKGPGAAWIGLLLVGALLPIGAAAAAPGQKTTALQPSPQGEEDDADARIRRLEQQIQAMEKEHLRQIRELREELATLQTELEVAAETQEQEELEELLAEVDELTLAEQAREEQAEKQRESFVGGERALQALNPEISFLGDFSYDWTDGEIRDGFVTRGVEISMQASLDPYTRFKATLAGHEEPFGLAEHHHEEEAEHHEEGEEHGDEHEGEEEDEHGHGSEIGLNVEEAYMEWVALPLNTRLRVGKFRQQFGTLNRWHPHSLPTTDSPFALQNVFGHEGLVGLGIGADWQLPGLWASANGLTLEITNADNPSAFAGADWDDPVVLLRHTGFFDLGPNAYLDLGLNWARGPNDASGDRMTTLAGVDAAFVWEPANRAKYRNFEFRGEFIRSEFETVDMGDITADSFYGYLSTRLSRRWSAGIRYDSAELPSDRFTLIEPEEFREGLKETAWTPFLTFWQSEYVRLRLQYQRASRDFTFARGGDSDEKLWLQVTFAAGPHKHESY